MLTMDCLYLSSTTTSENQRWFLYMGNGLCFPWHVLSPKQETYIYKYILQGVLPYIVSIVIGIYLLLRKYVAYCKTNVGEIYESMEVYSTLLFTNVMITMIEGNFTVFSQIFQIHSSSELNVWLFVICVCIPPCANPLLYIMSKEHIIKRKTSEKHLMLLLKRTI